MNNVGKIEPGTETNYFRILPKNWITTGCPSVILDYFGNFTLFFLNYQRL